MIQKYYDKICLNVYDTREEMGIKAASEAAKCIRSLLAVETQINCVFAAAPSQNEFLSALCREEGIDWPRINAYHMDEYIGIPSGDTRSFGMFLMDHIFGRVPFKSIHLIQGTADPDKEQLRYASLLDSIPIHITFMGIGENGHIAFNDPHEADFHDPVSMKKVRLDQICRLQQVYDGCFPDLETVPEYALTMTCPKLVSAQHIFCIVPSAAKREALTNCLTGPVLEACPASILRKKEHVFIYTDKACAGHLL